MGNERPMPSHGHDQKRSDRLSIPSRSGSAVAHADQHAQGTDEGAMKVASAQLLFDAGKSDLFYATTYQGDAGKPKNATLNIATLQRMALHHLQQRIAKYVEASYRKGAMVIDTQAQPSRLRIGLNLHSLLHQYCEAVRDYDYMKQAASHGPYEDPFKILASRTIERRVLEDVGLLPDHLLPKGELPPADDANDSTPKLYGGSRTQANKEQAREKRLMRLGMAAAGGLLPVVPMLIMANVPGKIVSLITTTVAMLIFAVLVTLKTELGPHEVLTCTAAYAAVLVVFVGTSLAPQS